MENQSRNSTPPQPYSAAPITRSRSNLSQLLNTNNIAEPHQPPNPNDDGSSSDSTTRSVRSIQQTYSNMARSSLQVSRHQSRQPPTTCSLSCQPSFIPQNEPTSYSESRYHSRSHHTDYNRSISPAQRPSSRSRS